MAKDRFHMIIEVNIKIPFWDAVKLRIAGKEVADVIKKKLGDNLNSPHEDEVDLRHMGNIDLNQPHMGGSCDD